MNKSILVLAIALMVAIVAAMMFGRDLQRERGRADALARRVAELEPVETPIHSFETSVSADRASNTYFDDAIERAEEQPIAVNRVEQPEIAREYHGSARARQQIKRLQAALSGGTPLQEYQIQPLITAIDRARQEVASERKTAQASTSSQSEREKIIQAASDILFESQLETFIELLAREFDDAKTK